VRTYNTIITACNKSGQPDEGLAVYDRMMATGVAPSATTYTALISAYGKQGRVDKALAVFGGGWGAVGVGVGGLGGRGKGRVYRAGKRCIGGSKRVCGAEGCSSSGQQAGGGCSTLVQGWYRTRTHTS
jgi:pentatricopeptide repeat protein